MKKIARLLRTALKPSDHMGHNYRTYGTSFGVHDYEDYVVLARKFYREAMNSNAPEYTVVKIKGDRTAIDYNGEVRGVYDKNGEPVAFFRPNYRSLGYNNRDEELEQFRLSKTAIV